MPMTAITTRLRLALLLATAALLAACADGRNLGDERAELGDFRLAHNIVVASNAQMGPFSRTATAEEWEESIRNAVARRFDRYEGTRLYHIAVSVDGYVLAMPGVPLVASPRSALIIGVHLWDDELGRPLNEERKQITVLESLSGETLVSSGLTQSAEQQMQNLSTNAALQIENWLAENAEWFNTGAAAAGAQSPGAGEEEALSEEGAGEDA
jgi:hypothetical protein